MGSGSAVGAVVGAAPTVAAADAAVDGATLAEAPALLQAPRTMARTANKASSKRMGGWDGTDTGDLLRTRVASEVPRGIANPSLRWVEGRGLSRWIARSCLPFSRRFEHAP